MENLRSKPVEDLGSTVLELYLWVFSTDATILSMTYTPTPNFGGSVTAGEFTFHYDACGNMVLMTNSSGDPQLSYDIGRATNGIVNTYNPGNMENIIGIGGKRGQLTIPGFGDDDMTLPIQRPGQFAVIGDNGQAGSGWIQDVDSSGSSPGITGPCGEVGMCGPGGYDFWDVDSVCFNECWAGKGIGTGNWEVDQVNIFDYLAAEWALGSKSGWLLDWLAGKAASFIDFPSLNIFKNPDPLKEEMRKKSKKELQAIQNNMKKPRTKDNPTGNPNLFDKNGNFREADIHNAISDCIEKCKGKGRNPRKPGDLITPVPNSQGGCSNTNDI